MMPAPELVDRFRADLTRVWPLSEDPGARLGLAVSGGGDSLALLLLAQAALPGRIEAATVDHGLRAESGDEAAFVAGVCSELGVPHRTLPVTVATGNLQDRARAARYAALGEWCEAHGLDALATAHQMDDQAETVVMRLNRGSGLSGLAAIRALQSLPEVPVPLVRPLLGWRRAELASLVADAGWEAVDDPSNHSDTFDRVRLRKALAGADWLDPKAISHSAALLGEADDALIWAVGQEVAQFVRRTSEMAHYAALASGAPALIRAEAVRSIYRGFGHSLDRGAAADIVRRLVSGQSGNVAGLQFGVADEGGERVWTFRPENPRRTG